MSSESKPAKVLKKVVSPDGRGGFWVPVVLAAIGAGILLSGIFSGATGLYGDVGEVSFSDGINESLRELVRLVLFSCLLLAALRINCWRIRRQLGNLLLSALRCLAVVALVEAVRVAQIPHGPVRILLIIATQFVVCCICVLWLFSMTIREVILFVTSCAIGAAILWVGSQVGTWIA
ncbi:MAG: hypothetical protein QF444_03870 [Phycisphaerales bacterium]|nr:hypothetical protein [Phycisphaerales bacterium]